MKKIIQFYAILLLLVLSTFSMNAQSLVMVSNDTNIKGLYDEAEIDINAVFKNVSQKSIEVNCLMEIVSLANGINDKFETVTHKASFCWGDPLQGVCYPGKTAAFMSTFSVELKAGETLGDRWFIGKLFPNEYKGTSVIKYTFVNVNDANDKVSFEVSVLATDVNSIEDENFDNMMSLYPNPSNEVLNVNLSNAYSLTIVDLLGNQVYSTNKSEQVNLANFANGSYVAILNKEGKTVKTKSFVVAK